MTHNPPTDPVPPVDDDRIRLLKSLAAAVLIASSGFALIYMFFGFLPWFTFHWLSMLPPAKATHFLSMMTIFARAFTVLTGMLT
jgi:hypothetical protein